VSSGAARGWGAVIGLTVLTATFSVLHPAVLIFTPLGVLLLAYAPRRPVWLGLAALLLFVGLRGGGNPVWDVERGWSLIVAAWFVVAVMILPRSRFLSRALLAVGAAVMSALLMFGLAGGGFTRVDERIARELRTAALDVVDTWTGLNGSGFQQQVGDAVRRAAELQVALYPALLALASMTGLAVAWWAFSRLTARDAAPLGTLREFRFHDGLVWILIGGLALVLAPLDQLAERIGSNVLAFMGALYALRGVAVLIVVGGMPGPVGWLIGGVIALLLYPFVVATTFFVGLSDTWLDLRTRRAARVDPSNGGEGQ